MTLNHLAWAAALGVPTGLMALQGNDAYGRQIRDKMGDLGVSTAYVHVGDEYATSMTHVLSERQVAYVWLCQLGSLRATCGLR